VIPTNLAQEPSSSKAPGALLSSASSAESVPSTPQASRARSTRRWRDADILLALSALWVVSVIRVVGASVHREVFGAEATLAFLSMFAIPWLAVRARLPRPRPDARPHLRLVGGSDVARRRG
jgi:hypothetical protein